MPSCAKLIPIVLLTLGSALAAPSSNSQIPEYWINPCSNHVRHQRSAVFEKEFNFFIHVFNKDFFKDLKKIYPGGVKKVPGQCPRVKSLVGGALKNDLSAYVGYQRIYFALLGFAAFRDKLENISINSQNVKFNFEKRRTIYQKTGDSLRLTICEFNDMFLNDFNKKQPKNKTMAKFNRIEKNTECLPKVADLSQIQMLDIQFFKKLKRFLREGRRWLKKLKQKEKNQKQRTNR